MQENDKTTPSRDEEAKKRLQGELAGRLPQGAPYANVQELVRDLGLGTEGPRA